MKLAAFHQLVERTAARRTHNGYCVAFERFDPGYRKPGVFGGCGDWRYDQLPETGETAFATAEAAWQAAEALDICAPTVGEGAVRNLFIFEAGQSSTTKPPKYRGRFLRQTDGAGRRLGW